MSKHPLDRRVFFTRQRNDFLSVRDVQRLYMSGELSAFDLTFSVDGDSYRTSDVASGKAPEWAMTAENDPMLYDCSHLSEEDIALADELALECDFLEMPTEPEAKTVKDFLLCEPQIACMIANTERWDVPMAAGLVESTH